MAHYPISLTARKPSLLKNNQTGGSLALLFVLPLLLTGCSHFRTELGKSQVMDRTAFVEGETTVQNVIHTLGPPTQIAVLPDGFSCLYEHSEIGEFQLGL